MILSETSRGHRILQSGRTTGDDICSQYDIEENSIVSYALSFVAYFKSNVRSSSNGYVVSACKIYHVKFVDSIFRRWMRRSIRVPSHAVSTYLKCSHPKQRAQEMNLRTMPK